MTVEIYKFKIKQSHFGADSKGVGVEKVSEWLHSDTIFSALVNSYARCCGKDKTDKFVNDGKPNFRVSSGFLCRGEELFFPKPIGFMHGEKEQNPEFLKRLKALKKVSFLKLPTLKEWFEKDISNLKEFYEKVISDGEDYQTLFNHRVKGVNVIDRINNKAVPFYRGEIFYEEDTRFWFFVKYEKSESKQEFQKAVEALQEVGGFGGELNIGYGRVESFEKSEFTDLDFGFEAGKQNLLLSLAGNSKETPKLDSATYDLVLRKGYVGFNSQRKIPVWAFREGSVFESEFQGEIIEVGKKTGHSVYRDLRPFWVNF